VLDEAEQRPEYRGTLLKLLDRFLTRADDRALFNLPTQLPTDRTTGQADASTDTPAELSPVAASGFDEGRSQPRPTERCFAL
jgi:hypothetical protein